MKSEPIILLLVMLTMIAILGSLNVYEASVVRDQRILIEQMVQNPACHAARAEAPARRPCRDQQLRPRPTDQETTTTKRHLGGTMSRFDDDNFYRPTFPAMQEYDQEFAYLQQRAANRNAGENTLLGMIALGNAFRFITNLYVKGELKFTPYRLAIRLIAEKYEALRQEAYLNLFNPNYQDTGGL